MFMSVLDAPEPMPEVAPMEPVPVAAGAVVGAAAFGSVAMFLSLEACGALAGAVPAFAGAVWVAESGPVCLAGSVADVAAAPKPGVPTPGPVDELGKELAPQVLDTICMFEILNLLSWVIEPVNVAVCPTC